MSSRRISPSTLGLLLKKNDLDPSLFENLKRFVYSHPVEKQEDALRKRLAQFLAAETPSPTCTVPHREPSLADALKQAGCIYMGRGVGSCQLACRSGRRPASEVVAEYKRNCPSNFQDTQHRDPPPLPEKPVTISREACVRAADTIRAEIAAGGSKKDHQ